MYLQIGFAVLLLSACSFDPTTSGTSGSSDGGLPPDGAGDVDDGGTTPATTDADPPPDAELDCVGDLLGFVPMNVDRCDPPDAEGPLSLTSPGDYRLDTDTGVLTTPFGSTSTLVYEVVPQVAGADLFVTSATHFQVGLVARLLLTGSRPFVIVSTGDIDISGSLLATASDSSSGAGGNLDVSCLPLGRGLGGTTQEDEDSENIGGSGGGGGAFAAFGGRGAKVDGAEEDSTPGGVQAADNGLVPLRGGCAGGDGGSFGGQGGGAGGAIQLVAADTIYISGRISVSGGGGRGVQGSASGGGGGGSGGGILLQADTLEQSGVITSNGGAGGEGSRSNGSSASGSNGYVSVNLPSPGGSGQSSGGNGGNGGTRSEIARDGQQGNGNNGHAAGGGGGGGSHGRIRVEVLSP